MTKRLNIYRNIALFAALQLWLNAAIACANVLLVSSNSHFAMVHRIEATLYAQPHTALKIEHLVAENVKADHFQQTKDDNCLIVAIGSEALHAILKTKCKKPILSVLSRKSSINTLLHEHDRKLGDPSAPISAIYLDQPLERQLLLLQCLMPNHETNSIGVLLGPNSLIEQTQLQTLASKHHIKLNTIYVNKFENPVAVLDGLLDETQMVLAIPDHRVYNTKTTRGMLLTAFHKRVPLIGYSRTYVNNGALAGVYSTTKQLADQTAKQIIDILATNDVKLPQPQYPQDFTIAVNHQVARSLGLFVENETVLKQTIEKMEKLNHG
ncbi:MAG: ABC transporter substrate-binding protein [Candidatus Berkiella sp.]